MNNKTLILIITVACLALVYFLTKPTPATDIPTAQTSLATSSKTFVLVVRNRKLFSSPDLLKATVGDNISIRITSDTAEELHLHGYDISVEIPANQTAELNFQASKTGRFPYELEKEGIELGNLEVDPK